MTRKIGIEDWKELWKKMVQSGIDFNFETRRGVIFLTPSPLKRFGSVLFIGESEEEVNMYFEKYCTL